MVTMKKILFTLLIIITIISVSKVFAEDIDNLKPSGYINDYTNTLSYNTKSTLENVSRSLEKKTSAEVVVVMVSTTRPMEIEDYSEKLFKKWGIGKKGKDNGVLFLAAKNDRKMRIETGYGLEGVLPDGLCGRIIKEVIAPKFKTGDFDNGVINGYLQIVNKVCQEYNINLRDVLADAGSQGLDARLGRRSTLLGLIKLIFTAVFILLFLGGRLGLFPLLFLGAMGGGRGDYWGGSGGGFGGGFGGFGGGGSGGGGASGSW